jgi:hypothetical protein
MKYNYYYNTIPEAGKVRNNLIYTSLINEDQTVFVKWFHNDSEYHMGMNEVVDPELMESKWQRELKYLRFMHASHNDLVPKILDIDEKNKKIYLEIDGVDFWQKHYDNNCTFEQVVPDWQDQMLSIIQAHKKMGLYKYSMHPSSYFIVKGRLKSINYFFTYHKDEDAVTLNEFKSHISLERRAKLESIMQNMGLTWDSKVPFNDMQMLCFESFRSNYSDNFIDKAKEIYVN